MEMWLWQLVLLSVTGMVFSADTVIIVSETSGNKVISEGSSVILHCRLWTSVPERYRVKWKFNPNGTSENGSTTMLEQTIKQNSSAETTKVTAAHLNEEDSRETLATYEFIASQNNSGWYSCHAKAEIPIYRSNNSNWTHIDVGMVVSAPTVIILNETSGNKVISEGSSVILHCRLWTIVLEQYRVKWKFNPNGPSENGSQILSKYRKNNSNANTTKDTAAHLNEEDSRETLATYEFIASQNNTGWYSCHAKAEIPFYMSNNSNWTHIDVEESLTEKTMSQTMTKVYDGASLWNKWKQPV